MNGNQGSGQHPARGHEKAWVTLDALLHRCVQCGASDLHLASGARPMFRVLGSLIADDADAQMDTGVTEEIAAALLNRADLAELEPSGSKDGAFTNSAGTRFRFNVFRTMRGLGIAIRQLEDRFWRLGELGLPEPLYDLCSLQDGLVVVAGPTGSGKSTTLATLIDHIHRTRACHVITIEDPIEYIHDDGLGLIQQRQVGTHTPDFHTALVAALREDPDVILLGEIRDLETIRTAIRAAETGHLVFTTVHASDCVGAIERMTAVFPPEEQAGIRAQLSLVLRTVLAQRLLPGLPNPAASKRSDEGSKHFHRRVVACEILVNTPAVANLIVSARSAQIYAAMETGRKYGMQTFEHDLGQLVAANRIAPLTARAHARAPDAILGARR